MQAVALLAAPYLSVLAICRSRRVARRVAAHTAVTLPVGWVAVLALLAAVVAAWSPPLAALAVLATLSGLAMITAGGRGGEDDEPGDAGLPPEPGWDAFDDARRRWAGDRLGPRVRPRTPVG